MCGVAVGVEVVAVVVYVLWLVLIVGCAVVGADDVTGECQCAVEVDVR